MKRQTIILIVLIFLFFSTYVARQNSDYTVLEVIAPNKIGVDLNKNNILENEEIVFVKDVEVLDLNQVKSLNISDEEALGLEYLGNDFAKNILKNKDIKFKTINGKKNVIIFENQDYAKKFNYSAFAFKNGKPLNIELFNKELQKIRKNPLKLYNNKTNKYHCLNCKYGKISDDFVILTKSQLPKNAEKCRFCNIETDKNESKKILLTYSNGAIKLFLTDLTTNLTSDNNCKTDLCKEILHQINSAQTSIDIAIYGYDNIPKLTTALKNAVNRGVNIRLVYDNFFRNKNFYQDTKILTEIIKQNNSDINSKNFSNAIMHNKFFIFDNKKVITGSANLSKTDMSGFNSNSVVLINSKEVANIYTKEFEQMYFGSFHTAKSIKSDNMKIKLGNSNISIHFSPQNSTVKTAIIPLIDNSKKYIYIPSFLITHDTFTKSLINAKNRKVDVKIILDAANIAQKYSKSKELRKNGVLVKCENYAGKMHSKSIIIDDKYIILGSMNFSNSGETKNDENVIIIEDTVLAGFYREFFEYLWKKIPERYLKYNVSAESINSIGSCSDGIDNDFDGKTDMNDEGCKGFKGFKRF